MTFISMILAFLVIGGLVVYMNGSRSSGNENRHSRSLSPDPAKPVNGLDIELITTRWGEIMAMQNHGGLGLRNALMEADKLLDYVMQGKNFPGDNMGDRLKSMGHKFSDLNGIWTAHKLRNQIAHEVAIDIVPSQVQSALKAFRQGIVDLGIPLP